MLETHSELITVEDVTQLNLDVRRHQRMNDLIHYKKFINFSLSFLSFLKFIIISNVCLYYNLNYIISINYVLKHLLFNL